VIGSQSGDYDSERAVEFIDITERLEMRRRF
jgi:hypothetical protein